MNSIKEIVRLEKISKVYTAHDEEYSAVRDVSFCADQGEMTLILGPSGSGKTTLLTILAGFLKPTTGDVFLFGRNINEYSAGELQSIRTEKIGFVFQTFLLIDSLTVYENISLVHKFFKVKPADAKKRVFNAMERTGISHLGKKRPYELSHGERQRAAIARAFINSARLLIADEPTASVEAEQGENLISLLHSASKESGASVIIASHDQRIKPFADKVMYIENGILRGKQ